MAPRPAAVASGKEAEVPALLPSKNKKLRVESGRLPTTSPLSVSPKVELEVLTVGAASPETSTSVVTSPTSKVTWRLVTSVMLTITGSTTLRRNPVCSTVTLYLPGATSANTTTPSVAVSLMTGAETGDSRVTLAFSIAPPLVSVTVSRTAPVCDVI